MSEKIRVLLSEEEVDARIQEVADMINKDYDGCTHDLRSERRRFLYV